MKSLVFWFPRLTKLCIAMISGILIFSASPLSAHSFIHRDGKLLKDSTEKTIKLKGVNLGGWLLWEGWIWGGGFTRQGKILEQMEILTGKNNTDEFRDNVYRNFITEEDIRQVSQMGFNVVRVPFNNRIFDTLSSNAIGWQILDSLLGWCKKYHVYAVLDMHGAPGGQSHYFIADPETPYLWKSEPGREKTIALWKMIAARYKDNPVVAGYDLLNEPIPVSNHSLLDLYTDIIAAIRSVDKNHLLIVEGSSFATEFGFFKSLPDSNMVLSFHIYTWLGGTPENRMAKYSEIANRLDVPMWCGEWGENNYLVVRETLESFAREGDNICGWCFWTWKKVPNKYPALNGIVIDEHWSKFINWCSFPINKNQPGTDEALAAMKSFENAMLYNNTKRDDILGKLLSDDAKIK